MKTPPYQKKASDAYVQRQQKLGMTRVTFWIKPAWKVKLVELLQKLKNAKK